MTTEEIAELRKLCEAASPGPWIHDRYTDVVWRRDARGVSPPPDSNDDVPPLHRQLLCQVLLREEDAVFIAAARTALPILLEDTRPIWIVHREMSQKIVRLEAWQTKARDLLTSCGFFCGDPNCESPTCMTARALLDDERQEKIP